jgi:tetratricopeptide (TPR) repeat protein
VRVRDGKNLWAGKFDERLTELFLMEDRIAADVAQALSVRLRAVGDRHASSQPEVYEQYLTGRQFFLEATVRGTRRAIQCFESALQRDPGFAPAYGMLALSYWQVSQRGGGPASEVRDKLWAAANKAVQLDPNNVEGHIALSMAKMWLEYDWDGGRREYERALQLSPRQFLVHIPWGMHAIAHGRLDEAERAYRQELEMSPNAVMSTVAMGYPALYAGRYDEAIRWYKKALDLDPAFPVAYNELAIAYNFKGMFPEFVEAQLKAAELSGAPAEEVARRHEIFRKEGITGYRRDALRISLSRIDKGQWVSPVTMARSYYGLGEIPACLDWLEKAAAEHTFQVLWLKSLPGWDNLHKEPRYHALLRQMRLE